MRKSIRAAMLALWFGTLALAADASQPRLMIMPSAPRAGEPVSVALQNTPAAFLPAYRHWRHQNLFTVDFELDSSDFGPRSLAYGWQPLPLGELSPGRYTVDARLHERGRPEVAPQRLMIEFDVAPPADWGVWSVPARPGAHEPFEVFVHSAAWLDPQSVRASTADGVVRIDFEFVPLAPGASPPPSATRAAAVRLAGLQPGGYRLEAWGSPRAGTAQRYFSKTLEVQYASHVVEYYSEALGHYFMAADADEVALLDDYRSGWRRTGMGFGGWLRWADALPGAAPVCRFYAKGPNSHFYTADARECEDLRELERAARTRPEPFLGWAYEGIAFYAIAAREGQCPRGTTPVSRAYNGGGTTNGNHRFMASPWLVATMDGWTLEGVAFCSPD